MNIAILRSTTSRSFTHKLRIVSGALLLAASSHSSATPPMLLEKTLSASDGAPEGHFGTASAVDGNVAVVTATNAGTEPENDMFPGAAYVFERASNGTWSQTAKLVPARSDGFGISAAIEGNVIAIGTSSSVYVFERTSAGWSQTAQLNANGYKVAIKNGVLITSRWEGASLFKRGSSGWAPIAQFDQGIAMNDVDYPGTAVDISATTAIHSSYGAPEADDPIPAAAYIYSLGPNGSWPTTPTATLTGSSHFGRYSDVVSIDNDLAAVGDLAWSYVYKRDTSGTWQQELQTPSRDTRIDQQSALAMGLEYRFAQLYRRSSSGAWSIVATLPYDNGGRANSPDIRGNRAIIGSHLFEIPSSLPQRSIAQEDLEDGVANNWQPLAAANFSVVPGNGTNVYRQLSVTGDAGAMRSGIDWNTVAIQADMTPLSWSGADRWAGLMVRYVDASNFYYMTLRSGNSVQIKRMVNGQFSTLTSASLPVELNRTYRLRFEAFGKKLRGYVDGQLLLETEDSTHTHGTAGIMMYKAQADFDNLLVSPNPLLTLREGELHGSAIEGYPQSDGAWAFHSDDRMLHQSSVTGDARYPIPSTIGDQIIEVDAQATQFSGNDRWFGVMARYRDESNYYYLSLRSSNSVSLRKLANGAITVLDTAPVTVTTGTRYKLRLEVVGNKLRGFVDDHLVVEATDTGTPLPAGGYGMVTYKAAATYGSFRATQP